MLNKTRWNQLLVRLTGNPAPEDSFQRLVAAYAEPQRFYHDSSHIEHCLAEFDMVANLCASPDKVECAIWLHDVIYDPHTSDNEAQSARFAQEMLAQANCAAAISITIQQLILATQHISPPTTPDAQLLVDIDLSILGQPPVVFQTYEENIRAEYAWVAEAAYRIGRAKILQSFLDKPSIYSTDRFNKMYGDQARENLTKALAALTLSPEAAHRLG